jgi:A/G-specific adenine glycosylase
MTLPIATDECNAHVVRNCGSCRMISGAAPVRTMRTVLGRATEFRRKLLRWYEASRRELPWRIPRGSAGTPDPYHVLVSEAMLQQTQVATVVPYFKRFLRRFPTIRSLADAPEQEVLRLWQGLGYYSRARNLQATARVVVSEHGGKLPTDAAELLKLPGIGRYTAGAIASIAFGRRAAILDGNVTRVLCRIDGITSDPRERQTAQRLWQRAEELLPRTRVGDFNSALMELGATVCTPRNPQCLICPVRAHCEAAAAGVQERIPPPRKARLTPLIRRCTYCVYKDERFLIEQRPATGRWAGMWQFITFDPSDKAPDVPTGAERLGTVFHALTHRRYEFEVYFARTCGEDARRPEARRRWVTQRELDNYPLPRPHLKVLGLALDRLRRQGP